MRNTMCETNYNTYRSLHFHFHPIKTHLEGCIISQWKLLRTFIRFTCSIRLAWRLWSPRAQSKTDIYRRILSLLIRGFGKLTFWLLRNYKWWIKDEGKEILSTAVSLDRQTKRMRLTNQLLNSIKFLYWKSKMGRSQTVDDLLSRNNCTHLIRPFCPTFLTLMHDDAHPYWGILPCSPWILEIDFVMLATIFFVRIWVGLFPQQVACFIDTT